MPTTIKQGFEQLREKLEITDLQEQTVSTRQKNIREALDTELEVLDSFLTGSYRRSTMIAPLAGADVDIFIVLAPKYFDHGGQTALLDNVKKVLKKSYKTPDISRNGQAVTIVFSDFKVDVVPGFYRQGGGFLIPDSIGKRWISTDPKKHVELWAMSNKTHRGNLVPLIKMIKGWNKMHGELLSSFHLECMIQEILTNITITDFPSGCRYVFEHASSKVHGAICDPAGYSGDVGASMSIMNKRAVAVALTAAYKLAYEAEQLERVNRTAEAFEKWRKIFVSYFPVYS
jgi:hypothetical protein